MPTARKIGRGEEHVLNFQPGAVNGSVLLTKSLSLLPQSVSPTIWAPWEKPISAIGTLGQLLWKAWNLLSFCKARSLGRKFGHAYYDSIMHRLNSLDFGGHVTSEGSDGRRILNAIRGAIGNLLILTYQMLCQSNSKMANVPWSKSHSQHVP